jgi:hypothetical protein
MHLQVANGVQDVVFFGCTSVAGELDKNHEHHEIADASDLEFSEIPGAIKF